jgi:hypothetical protein
MLRFIKEKTIEEGKEVATNGNKFRVEFELKNFKAWLNKIRIMVCE